MQRSQLLAALDDPSEWDVFIIGGGATGLGAALDACLRGYRTLLVEASDFAKGTSSRSTKLIHGGVRYLRSGQIGMVRESLNERGRLLQNAPHIAHPARFVIPAYGRGQRWFYYVGMKLYDSLAGKRNIAPAQLLSAASVKEHLPTLRSDGLRGGVLYSDGQFDDARLALALAQSALDSGGTVVNYARVVRLEHRGGKVVGATVRDEETGTEYGIRARTVINATGVFARQVIDLDEAVDAGQRTTIVPSRGTHIVVDADFLPGNEALLIPETDDGRVLFAIPWQGRLLVGTTDQATEQVSLEPQPEAAEIEYLLNHAGRYLAAKPQLADVRSTFAGLRPLVGKPGKEGSTAGLSREHEISVSKSGLISVIGGKWTTYRQMGQDVVDLAARTAALPERACGTHDYRLFGAERATSATYDWSSPLAGFEPFRDELAQLIKADPSLSEPLHSKLPFKKAHAVLAVRNELARTTDDVLARRTRALLVDAAAAVEAAKTVAALIGKELGSSPERIAADQTAFEQIARQYLPR